MKRLCLILLFGILVAVFIFAGCAQTAPSPTPAPAPAPKPSPTATPPPAFSITLKTHFYGPPDPINAQQKNKWCDLVTDETKGKVKFEHFYMEALGKAKDQLSNLGTGLFDLALIAAFHNPALMPLHQVGWLPSIPTTDVMAQTNAWFDLEKLPEMEQEFAKQNAKVLINLPGGTRWLFSSKPVRTLEDLKGLKIRAGSTSVAKVFAALGATSISMTSPDMYEALQKGTIQALEVPFSALVAYKWSDIAKIWITIPTGIAGIIWAMNLDTWKKLPADIQNIMLEITLKKFPDILVKMVDEEDGKRLEEFKAIGGVKIEFPEADLRKYNEIGVKPVVDGWADEMESKKLPGRKIYSAYVEYMKKYSK